MNDAGAPNTGVSIYRPAFPADSQYRQILLDTKPLDGIKVQYNFSGDVKLMPKTSRIVLAATTCLAAGVPDGTPLYYSVQLPVQKKKFSITPMKPSPKTKPRCSYSPLVDTKLEKEYL